LDKIFNDIFSKDSKALDDIVIIYVIQIEQLNGIPYYGLG
jgi:hypothetical protein